MRLWVKSCAFVAWQAQTDDPSPIRLAMSVRQHLKDYGLATYKIPDRVEFIEQFPYTAFGKIDKKDYVNNLKPTLMFLLKDKGKI